MCLVDAREEGATEREAFGARSLLPKLCNNNKKLSARGQDLLLLLLFMMIIYDGIIKKAKNSTKEGSNCIYTQVWPSNQSTKLARTIERERDKRRRAQKERRRERERARARARASSLITMSEFECVLSLCQVFLSATSGQRRPEIVISLRYVIDIQKEEEMFHNKCCKMSVRPCQIRTRFYSPSNIKLSISFTCISCRWLARIV